MTRYAVELARNTLIASWGTGTGDVASTVTELPPSAPEGKVQDLSEALINLSQALWRCYTHPASAADSLEPNTEGWRRQGSRDEFATVIPAISKPNLPHGGMLIQSYVPVEESAHQVGRALYAIGDSGLTNRIIDDVQAELDAVERAECGDLSGRSRQAVELTREDASPVQVAAADRLLREDPLDGSRLFTEVDPTAAAVAAAHWLQAAAEVAADVSGLDATQVVLEADNIEALPHESPTLVLQQLADDISPRTVITGLIRDAMMVTAGRIPDIEGLAAQVEEAKRRAEQFGPGDPRLLAELISSVRATPLDPARPALDLLEDLLSGIRGCWLIFSEYADAPGARDQGDDDPDDDGERDAIDEDEAEDFDDDALAEEFLEAVRVMAAEEHDRLL